MRQDGVRALEGRLESFFTPWAWQWNLSTTPEFGAHLGATIVYTYHYILTTHHQNRSPDTPSQESIH